jgi:hypothetical protein
MAARIWAYQSDSPPRRLADRPFLHTFRAAGVLREMHSNVLFGDAKAAGRLTSVPSVCPPFRDAGDLKVWVSNRYPKHCSRLMPGAGRGVRGNQCSAQDRHGYHLAAQKFEGRLDALMILQLVDAGGTSRTLSAEQFDPGGRSPIPCGA